MKNLLVTLIMLVVGFSLVSCGKTTNETYVEQNFSFDDRVEVGTTIAPVLAGKSLNDLILESLSDNGYVVHSVSKFIQSDKGKIVCFYDKTPKEYALKVDSKYICRWRHINILKKTAKGYLSKNIEFRSF